MFKRATNSWILALAKITLQLTESRANVGNNVSLVLFLLTSETAIRQTDINRTLLIYCEKTSIYPFANCIALVTRSKHKLE